MDERAKCLQLPSLQLGSCGGARVQTRQVAGQVLPGDGGRRVVGVEGQLSDSGLQGGGLGLRTDPGRTSWIPARRTLRTPRLPAALEVSVLIDCPPRSAASLRKKVSRRESQKEKEIRKSKKVLVLPLQLQDTNRSVRLKRAETFHFGMRRRKTNLETFLESLPVSSETEGELFIKVLFFFVFSQQGGHRHRRGRRVFASASEHATRRNSR